MSREAKPDVDRTNEATPTPEGQHRCELCSTPVRVVQSGEGTAHYEPIPRRESAPPIGHAIGHDPEVADSKCESCESRAPSTWCGDCVREDYEISLEIPQLRAELAALRKVAEAARALREQETIFYKVQRTAERDALFVALWEALAHVDRLANATDTKTEKT